jgi:hypothetical protein
MRIAGDGPTFIRVGTRVNCSELVKPDLRSSIFGSWIYDRILLRGWSTWKSISFSFG